MIECIEISLKSFESKLVQNATSQIYTIYNQLPQDQSFMNTAVFVPKEDSKGQGQLEKNSELQSFGCVSAKHDASRQYSSKFRSILSEEHKQQYDVSWKFSTFSFPMSQKKFTVLRSPHIDKKSREQFKIQYFKNRILLRPLSSQFAQTDDQYLATQSAHNEQLCFFHLFIENMKRMKFFGVQVKIRIIYNTFLPNGGIKAIA